MRLGRPTVSLSSGTGHGDFEDLDSERLGTCRSWVRVAHFVVPSHVSKSNPKCLPDVRQGIRQPDTFLGLAGAQR